MTDEATRYAVQLDLQQVRQLQQQQLVGVQQLRLDRLTTTRVCRCCRGRWSNCDNCGGICMDGCDHGTVEEEQ